MQDPPILRLETRIKDLWTKDGPKRNDRGQRTKTRM